MCVSNNWWVNHMLSDILFTTQLLGTHLVTTFSGGDNQDILGIYLACDPKQQNKPSFSLRRVKHSAKPCLFCFLKPLERTAYLP